MADDPNAAKTSLLRTTLSTRRERETVSKMDAAFFWAGGRAEGRGVGGGGENNEMRKSLWGRTKRGQDGFQD